MWVIREVNIEVLLQQSDLSKEELVGRDPRDQYSGNNFPDAFLAESKVVTASYGRVDKEHSERKSVQLTQCGRIWYYFSSPRRIRAILVNDFVRIRVILQALAHFLTIPARF